MKATIRKLVTVVEETRVEMDRAVEPPAVRIEDGQVLDRGVLFEGRVDAELSQDADGAGTDTVAAGFVAGEGAPVDERDVESAPGRRVCGDRAGRTRADHDDVEHVVANAESGRADTGCRG